MSDNSRREFLRITIAGLGALLLPIPIGAVAAGLSGGNYPREIGATFMRSANSQARALQLKQRIEQIKSPQEMQDFISKSIDNDYRTGACFSFHTWQLSLTEGALCALYGS